MLQEARDNFRQIYAKFHSEDVAFDNFVSKEQEDKIRYILFYEPKKEIEEREIDK